VPEREPLTEEQIPQCSAAETESAEVLRCFRCGSTRIDYRLCKVFCLACGGLIENCSRD